MLKRFKKFMSEESGQGMAEYGLILALIAVVVIGALTAIGTGVLNNFNGVANALGAGTP
ncbi:MAG: Flp/Fap pilin component [Pelotomaculum thermopropionicum]|uniref:Flp/Fap pilin component n=1 Tax=Pelotomaculum thermopropionicum TaxID=110500 RepID=A0A117M4N4_9FIRM|nr:MAG: Flp/Fap pilin component [Pelotomaculum thermopropionicum]